MPNSWSEVIPNLIPGKLIEFDIKPFQTRAFAIREGIESIKNFSFGSISVEVLTLRGKERVEIIGEGLAVSEKDWELGSLYK